MLSVALIPNRFYNLYHTNSQLHEHILCIPFPSIPIGSDVLNRKGVSSEPLSNYTALSVHAPCTGFLSFLPWSFSFPYHRKQHHYEFI